MQLLKKSDIIEEGVVTFSNPQKCFHCAQRIKSRSNSWKIKFHSKSSSVYIHYKCKEDFHNSLRA